MVMRSIFKSLILVTMSLVSISSIMADGLYVGGGAGVQFDLGSLGSTIVKDGLDSTQPVQRSGSSSSNYQPYGTTQRAIVPENNLRPLETITNGLVKTDLNGAMTGGVANILLEYHFMKYFFVRGGFNYTKKVSGGYTEASILGHAKFYEITWNYESYIVPVYVGVNMTTPDEGAGVYMGVGAHYFKGGWGVKGTIATELLDQALANANTTNGTTGDSESYSRALFRSYPRPGIYNENAQFRASGVGFNFIFGLQAKVFNRFFTFFEFERLLNSTMSTAYTKSIGGAAALSSEPAYPVLLGGDIYRIGIKYKIL